MAEIIKFWKKNAAEDPDAVIEQALGEYDDVFIVGWDKEGNFDARASLGLKQKDILYLIELFKMKMMRGDYDHED